MVAVSVKKIAMMEEREEWLSASASLRYKINTITKMSGRETGPEYGHQSQVVKCEDAGGVGKIVISVGAVSVSTVAVGGSNMERP